MGVVFGWRGDQANARYSSAGKEPGYGGNGTTIRAELNTNQAGINGSTSLDMSGGNTTNLRPFVFNGRGNTPAVAARSVLIRAYFPDLTLALPLWYIGSTRGNVHTLGFGARIETSGEITYYVSNEAGQTDSGTSSGASIATGAWYDIGISWTGGTDANGVVVNINAANRLTDTAIRALPSWDTGYQRAVDSITLGVNNISSSRLANMYVDEFIVWDEVVDFTGTFTFDDDTTGSLNGALRTKYIKVNSYDGLASTGGDRQRGFGKFGS